MKILVYFIDMLRPNQLSTWNKNCTDTELDKWIREFGGTIYTRTYTPGPDTPRSQACVWTSRYPKFNGCDVRIKYPMYNLKNPKNNFFRVFIDAGYKINFFMIEQNRLLGELPEDFTDICSYSKNMLLEDYLKTIDVSDNSLTYIAIDDFHHAVTDFYSSRKAVDFGASQARKCLSVIDREIGLDTFDFILIYSDHGFAMSGEPMNNAFQQLGEGRTNVFMMTRRKGDTRLHQDVKIRSVLDIGPTLCEIAGLSIPYRIDGKSLLDSDGSEYIVISDHKSFNVDLCQTIEYWAIYNERGFAAVDCDMNWEADYELSEEEKKKFADILKEKGDFFEENTRASMILKYYKDFIQTADYYFDGTPRKRYPPAKQVVRELLRKLIKPLAPMIRKII